MRLTLTANFTAMKTQKINPPQLLVQTVYVMIRDRFLEWLLFLKICVHVGFAKVERKTIHSSSLECEKRKVERLGFQNHT